MNFAERTAKLRLFEAEQLDESQLLRWIEFQQTVATKHYQQDPRWADVERTDGRLSRRPCYLWCEEDGQIVLTAIAMRRSLPIPGRCFYEFPRGPVFSDPDVFEGWLLRVLPRLKRDAVRVRVSPFWELACGGDDVETGLERLGFRRRRLFGTWATLLLDIGRPEDELFATFHGDTRRNINRCMRGGVCVAQEDTPQGRADFCGLIRAMRVRADVEVITEGMLERASRSWFGDGSGGILLLARRDGMPAAGALIVRQGHRAFLRSLPSNRQSAKIPCSHLLVWEGIRWAMAQGCTIFDFDGYSLVAREEDPLGGVNRFKRGFVRPYTPVRYVAPHELITKPALHRLSRAARRLEGRRTR